MRTKMVDGSISNLVDINKESQCFDKWLCFSVQGPGLSGVLLEDHTYKLQQHADLEHGETMRHARNVHSFQPDEHT